jgi:hypothetical protein
MNENDLVEQAKDLAGRLIALANDMRDYKSNYDWYTWTQNAQQPIASIDAGVQNLDALQTDIHTTRRDALYNLAYATE